MLGAFTNSLRIPIFSVLPSFLGTKRDTNSYTDRYTDSNSRPYIVHRYAKCYSNTNSDCYSCTHESRTVVIVAHTVSPLSP